MSEKSLDLILSTERTILRPQRPNDYEAWYAGFAGRMESQHQYDDGLVSLEHCDREWFANLCQRHQQEALSDLFFIFGIFCRDTGEHFGNIDLITIRRENYQWAVIGYQIHNQHWRKGIGKEAV